MYLTMEAIKEKNLMVKYVHISGMTADGFTKVLGGSDFDFFVDQVLGKNKSTCGHWAYGPKQTGTNCDCARFMCEERIRMMKEVRVKWSWGSMREMDRISLGFSWDH